MTKISTQAHEPLMNFKGKITCVMQVYNDPDHPSVVTPFTDESSGAQIFISVRTENGFSLAQSEV